MKRLAYTGLKTDGERAFQERTGIEWFQGDQKDVADDVAAEMLKHPTIWCEVPTQAASTGLAAAAVPSGQQAETGDALPDWVKKGVELGATDDQLEAIAQAGGPGTEQGATLWKDATGTEWTPVDPVPVIVKPAAKKAAAKKATAKAKK